MIGYLPAGEVAATAHGGHDGDGHDSGSHSAGGFKGSFHIDGTGAATYHIPIRVAPGTNGMQPHLGFAFSSRQGNGTLGVGWSISGLAMITRCGQTTAQDGAPLGVTFTDTDRFCYGGQRLMAVQNSGGHDLTTESARAAAYGQDGTVYSTEMDSWTKFTSHGSAGSGPAYFTAMDKRGTQMWFGDTSVSASSAVTVPAGVGTSGTVRIWALSKVQDLYKNYLLVSWIQDQRSCGSDSAQGQSSGQIYPGWVKYTYNDGQSLTYQREVEFCYETRTDPILHYRAGAEIQTKKRLSSIAAKLDNSAFRTYNLAYAQDVVSGESLLTSITEVGNDGSSTLVPTTFSWSGQTTSPWGGTGHNASIDAFQQASTALSGKGSTWRPLAGELYLFLPADLNNDGLTDLLAVEKPSGTANAWLSQGGSSTVTFAFSSRDLSGYGSETKALLGNFDGQGGSDLLYLASGGNKLYQWAQGGDTFPADPVSIASDDCTRQATSSGAQAKAADVNGDGRSDLVISHPRERDKLYVSLAGGTPKAPTFNCLSGDYEAPTHSLSGEHAMLLAGKLSGDPWSDLLVLPNSNSYQPEVLRPRWSGSSLTLPSTASNVKPAKWADQPLPGDINGDGLLDVLGLSRSEDDYSPYALVSRGDGTLELKTSVGVPANQTQGARKFTGDFNRDGRMDYLVIDPLQSSRSRLCLANADLSYRCGKPGAFGTTFRSDQTVAQFGDFNGDGGTDIFAYTRNGTPTLYVSDLARPRLIGLTEGQGRKILLTYKPVTDASVYTAGNDTPSYPAFASNPASLEVVASHSFDDGNGNVSQFQHSYKGSVASHDGRGWQGFTEVTRTAVTNGTARTTQYNTDWPLTRRPGQTTLACTAGNPDGQCTAGTKLAQTTFTYWNKAGGGNHQYSQVRQVLTDTEAYERFHYGTANGTATITETWDAYGNRRTRKLEDSTNTGAALTDTATYYPVDATNHILNLQETMQTTDAGGKLLSSKKWTYVSGKTEIETSTVYTQLDHNVGASPLTQTFGYDDYGNRKTVTAPPKGQVTVHYDTTYHTFPATQSAPLGLSQSFQYDPRYGVQTSVTDYNSNQSQVELDPFGRVKGLKATGPSGLAETSTLERSVVNGLLTFTVKKALDWGASSWWQSIVSVDGFGREVEAKVSDDNGDSGWIVHDWIYDERGHLVSSTVPHLSSGSSAGKTQFAYDAYNRVVKTTQPNGRIDKTEYQANDVQKVTLASGAAEETSTTLCFDWVAGKAHLGRKIFPGYALDFALDDLGRVTGVSQVSATDCTGSRSGTQLLGQVYDLAGRKTQRVTPANTTVWTWNSGGGSNGSLQKRALYAPSDTYHSNALATASYTAYDAMGRLTSATYENGTPSETITYSYDKTPRGLTAPAGCDNLLGEMVAVQGGSGTQYTYQYCYDPAGQMAQRQAKLTHSGHHVTSSWKATYAPTGDWLSFTYDDGRKVARALTPGLHTASLTFSDSGGTLASGNWSSFDAFATPANQTFGSSGLSATAASDATTGLPASYSVKTSSGSLWSQTYGFDTLNRMCSIAQSPGDDQIYGYDSLGQLKAAATMTSAPGASCPNPSSHSPTAFSYSDDQDLETAGTRSFTPASTPEQLSSYTDSADSCGQVSVSYDDAGYLHTLTPADGSCADPGLTFTYDARRRLASVTAASGSGPTEYAYDHTGRRILKVSPSGAVTWYPSPYEQRFSPGGTPGASDPTTLERATSYGQRLTHTTGTTPGSASGVPEAGANYLFLDHLGSTRVATDAQGSNPTRLDYQPFGAFSIESGAADHVRAKYQGREWDADSRLYYFGARYYSPELGRFVTPDTRLGASRLSDFDAVKLYAFVGNNPINAVDPSGHSFWDIFRDIGVAIAGVAEVVAGVALDIVTDGAASDVSAGLIGAGVSSVSYMATHSGSSFSAAGWGESEGIGFVAGALGGAVGGGVGDIVGGMASDTAGIITTATVGAAVNNATTQALDIATGKQSKWNWAGFGIATGLGAAAGGLSSRLASAAKGFGSIASQASESLENFAPELDNLSEDIDQATSKAALLRKVAGEIRGSGDAAEEQLAYAAEASEEAGQLEERAAGAMTHRDFLEERYPQVQQEMQNKLELQQGFKTFRKLLKPVAPTIYKVIHGELLVHSPCNPAAGKCP